MTDSSLMQFSTLDQCRLIHSRHLVDRRKLKQVWYSPSCNCLVMLASVLSNIIFAFRNRIKVLLTLSRRVSFQQKTFTTAIFTVLSGIPSLGLAYLRQYCEFYSVNTLVTRRKKSVFSNRLSSSVNQIKIRTLSTKIS